jgi:hypothetical protein
VGEASTPQNAEDSFDFLSNPENDENVRIH